MSPIDPNPVLASLETGLHAALERAPAGHWVVTSIPVPGGAACALLDAELTEESSYFEAGRGSSSGDGSEICHQGATYVGLGALVSRRFEGPERFQRAKSFIQESFKQGQVPPELQPYVRFFGGAAFSPGRDGSGACWSEFGDARFLLPRCIYVDDGAGMLLCLATRESLKATLELAGEALARLGRTPAGNDERLHALSRSESEHPQSWRDMVEGIREEIAGGAVAKIVAARRITLQLSDSPRPSAVLQRLNSQAPLCARFALRIGRKTFIGATPERLVRRQGQAIETEALAGSIDVDHPNAADALLGSSKDREEHQLVIDALRLALEPLCAHLQVPEEPTIRRLRTILHLRTPISGHLARQQHVLELVEKLHPTPAVGGLPAAPAVEFINSHERAERGWYAAPVGWVDCNGDGEFVVALRSGLIADDKVHLYAGAGIVADSDSDAEFEETELKLSSMLGALGLDAAHFNADGGHARLPS